MAGVHTCPCVKGFRAYRRRINKRACELPVPCRKKALRDSQKITADGQGGFAPLTDYRRN